MRTGNTPEQWKVIALAPEPSVICDTQDTDGVFLGNPSIDALPGGRIVVCADQLGPGVVKLPGKKGKHPHDRTWIQGRIHTSGDHGASWDARDSYPYGNARLIRDGNLLYLLGDAGSLQISRSSDGGTTWSSPDDLTARDPEGDRFIQCPTEVLRANGSIYAATMINTDVKQKGNHVSVLAPVVMRAAEGSNLSNPKSWSYSTPVTAFRDLISQDRLDYFGIPFFNVPRTDRGESVGHGRWAERIGWYAPHIIRVMDPNHFWHDPSGHTFHILASASVHRSNVALLAKVRESDAGSMTLELETTPEGRPLSFLNVPGGSHKFHILYDESSSLYWLVSNESRDSMTRPDKLPRTRQDLPCDEDSRIQLHFSRNLVDWCFAGLVDAVEPGTFRGACAMATHGNDLYIAALGGTAEPGRKHHPTQLLLYAVSNFRDLAY